MARVLSEARKKLREAALARRQDVTTHEMARDVRKKRDRVKSEKDVYHRLGELPPKLVTAGGYPKFVFDPNRVTRIQMDRTFFFPGYGARLMQMPCLTILEANVALGMSEGKLKQLIKDGDFPTPLGKCYTHWNSDAYPAYTPRELLIYMHLLASMIGSPESWNYWSSNRLRVVPQLHAAREQIKEAVYTKGERKWKIKEERKSDDTSRSS